MVVSMKQAAIQPWLRRPPRSNFTRDDDDVVYTHTDIQHRLHDLIKTGVVHDIEALLSKVDCIDVEQKNMLLRSAIQRGDVDVAETMIMTLSCNPAFNNNWPILCACEVGHIKMVDLLLLMPGVCASDNSSAALVAACSNGHVEIVDKLLSSTGVDATVNSNLCFRLAAAAGHLAVVQRLLLVPGVEPFASQNYALRRSAARGHLGVVEFLLSLDKIEVPPETLYFAARHGHIAIVKLLISKQYCRASVDNLMALRLASASGHGDILRLLIETVVSDGDALSSVGITDAFLKAAHNGHLESMFIILHCDRASVKTDDGIVLLLATEANHKNIVRVLLDEFPHIYSSRVLIAAASLNDCGIINLLLLHERVQITSSQVHRAICEAASNGRLSVIIEILRCIPDTDPFSCGGDALLRSSSHGHADVVQELLKFPGASSFVQESLYRASSQGHLETVKCLLKQASNLCLFDTFRLRNSATRVFPDQLPSQKASLVPNHLGHRDAVASSLVAAAENGHINIVEAILKSEGDFIHCRAFALPLAARRGHVDVVSALLHPLLPRKSLELSFKAAVDSGSYLVVASFLRRGLCFRVHSMLTCPKNVQTIKRATQHLSMERENALRICLLLRLVSWPLWSFLRHRVLLFSHYHCLEGDTDIDKMNDLKQFIKRIDYSTFLTRSINAASERKRAAFASKGITRASSLISLDLSATTEPVSQATRRDSMSSFDDYKKLQSLRRRRMYHIMMD